MCTYGVIIQLDTVNTNLENIMQYISPLNRRRNFFSGTSIGDLENELNALFGAFVPAKAFASTRDNVGITWYESEEAYSARLDLPGVKAKDLELDIQDGTISLKAKRVFPKSGDDDQTVEIAKTVVVPEGVDHAKIGASHEDGVLSITFPKAEAAKPRKIEVAYQN